MRMGQPAAHQRLPEHSVGVCPYADSANRLRVYRRRGRECFEVYCLTNTLIGDILAPYYTANTPPMLIVLDLHSGVPTYRQIVEQVRLQIASGRLASGSELPSTRQLAQQLGINPMTVSKAYGLLEQEGAVEHRPGLPLMVRARSAATREAARENELRSALEPAARAVRQLGVSPAKAVQLFRQLIANSDSEMSE